MDEPSAPTALTGLRVLSLESRRSREMAKLIASYHGEPIVAPSMQEIPIESNAEALDFAAKLAEGAFDVVIFLTGVGTRALARLAETRYPREKFVAALQRVTIVARGPKPVAALGEMGLSVAVTAPEPNTWRELLRAIDERSATVPIRGKRVAVQEYGTSNPELLAGLAERGAIVTRVPIYEWSLPDDTGPLREAVRAIVRGGVDVALFTTSVQVVHLLKIAKDLDSEEVVLQSFSRIVVGSIGPVTSEALREHGLPVDFEPEHPKMGFLVSEAARRSRELLAKKRQS
jgi:uroporphyrinogen-III synthase